MKCITKFCRIDGSGVIKVADFGLTEDMYGTNYFRRRKSETGSEKVPIKWMAPESIESDIYDESTDVVRTIMCTTYSIYNESIDGGENMFIHDPQSYLLLGFRVFEINKYLSHSGHLV